MGGVYNSFNLQLYHYAGNNPVKYTDPNGKWSVTLGFTIDGVAFRIKFGKNDGVKEVELTVCVGAGAEASIDFSDNRFTDCETKIEVGTKATASLESEYGSFTLESEVSMGLETDANGEVSSSNTNEATITISDNTLQTELNIDKNGFDVNPEKCANTSIGGGAMVILGFTLTKSKEIE